MKLVVLGQSGQLGSLFNKINKLSTHEILYPSKAEVDLTDYESIIQYFKRHSPEVVINFSAYTNVDLAEKDKSTAYDINSKSLETLSSCVQSLKGTLIHLSTDYVFDGTSDKPYTEESQTNPTGVYGASKLEGEKNIISSECNFIILRTSWVFSEYGNNFLKTMLKLGAQRKSIKVVDDQIGCPTYGGDIVQVINKFIYMIERQNINSIKGIYNFCGNTVCSWFNFAEKVFTIANEFNLQVPEELIPITTEDFPTAAKRPKYSVLDCTKISNLLKVKPSNLEEGVKQAFEHLA